MLFARSYPAAVGFLLRVFDRDRRVPEASRALAEELAAEALARARVRRLPDSQRSVVRIFRWVADLGLPHLVGHPGRVPLPPGWGPAELLPTGEAVPGLHDEFVDRGLSLDELQAAVAGLPRRTRRVGLACLGAGLPTEETAALLGLDPGDVSTRVRRIGVALADRRRVDAELLGVGSGPGAEHR